MNKPLTLFDLPLEIVDQILSNLTFTEIYKYRSVCREWNELLTRQLQSISYQRIGTELELILHDPPIDEDEDERTHQYKWYMYPKAFKGYIPPRYENQEDAELYYGLCGFFGLGLIHYNYGMRDIPRRCEYYDINDDDSVRKEKRERWAWEQVERQIGTLQTKILRKYTTTFVEYITGRFGDIYNITLPLSKHIPIAFVKHTDTEFLLEFTLYEFAIEGGNARVNDYKMRASKSTCGQWVWNGLGDEWQHKTGIQIFKEFQPISNGHGDITIQLTARNANNTTISHILEAMTYMVLEHENGHHIEWK
jgi:hypothetical protein